MSMDHRTLVFTVCSCCVSIIGCAGYRVTINEQAVYNPRPLMAIEDIADPNLATCIEQTAADRQIVRAEQLTRLVCTYAGIETLEGLQQFSRLEQLNLGHNALDRVEVLYQLPELKHVQLEGNPDLSCGNVKTLEAMPREQLTIRAPAHCR